MRVLIVSQYYWPEPCRVADVAEGLRRRGHEVEVLTGLPNYPGGEFAEGYGLGGPWREVRNGVQIIRVPLLPRGGGGALRLSANYASYALAATLRVAVARTRWDVCFAFQLSPVTLVFPAVLLRALRGVPAAIWVQDLWPESVSSTGMVRSRLLFRMARWLSGWLYRRFDRVLGTSESFGQRLELLGVPSERYTCLPQWAEDLYVEPTVPAEPAPAWAGGFPVMFAGNLGRVQALDTILDAAELLQDDPEVRWVFAGDGSLAGWLGAEVARRGLQERVHLLGRRPAAEMPSLFAHAGAMLVTLKPDEVMALTIPGKVQSYMAAGRPIIASLDGEAARVVEEAGAGLSCPAGDAPALASAVARMKTLSVEERARMGRSGKAHYDRRFARDVGLDTLESALQAIASGASRDGATR